MGVRKGDKRGPYKRRVRPKKYVCTCSFGKDSIATVLLALENGEPLDAVVYSEVMFDNDRGISGELPEHIEWVKEVAIPRLRDMGVNVVHLRSEVDFMGCFHKIIGSGKNAGKKRAFPIARMCCIQRECKLAPIRKWYRENYFNGGGYDIVEYVGIAVDEVERLGSLDKSDMAKISKESLLAKYGYTETMAMLKCAEYDLLSPMYFNGSSRGGCWFCPNQGNGEFARLRRNHPELWGELRVLSQEENMASPCFKYDKSFDVVDNEVDEYEQKYGKWLS